MNKFQCIMPFVTRYTDLFTRVIVVDYYDGPVAGVGQTVNDRTVYEFQLLDQSENAEIRIMRVTRLPDGAFDRLVSICSQAEPPSWPMWVLGGQNRDIDAWLTYNAEIIAVRKIVSVPDYIIARRNSDDVILGIEAMDSPKWNEIEYKAYEWDWFGFLGLEKPQYPTHLFAAG